MITMYQYILFKPNKTCPIAAFVSGICLSYPVKYRNYRFTRNLLWVRYGTLLFPSASAEGEGHAPVTVGGDGQWALFVKRYDGLRCVSLHTNSDWFSY